MRKFISIVTPCYNEEENVLELCTRIKAVMDKLPYNYEHILIDNCSTDNTVAFLRNIARDDKNVKIIVNSRNFGHLRSPYYALMQTDSDASILLASDLQDPPEIINEFLAKWEKGYKAVLAVKPESEESFLMFTLRRLYYKFLSGISEIPLINNATGAGLYDRVIINELKKITAPYPYFRGLVCEIGFPTTTVPFKQPRRQRGITSNNFYTLYDAAILGITSHSKIPLRIMTIGGFLVSIFSLFVAMAFLVIKLIYWDSFQLGVAPIVIGVFLLGAIQMFCIGILGEYIGAIYTQVRNMPLAIESERINFE